MNTVYRSISTETTCMSVYKIQINREWCLNKIGFRKCFIQLKDDPTFLQSHSLCNISSLFTSYILSYPSKDKSLLKRGLQNNN